MRSRDAERTAWFAHLEAQRAAFEEERKAWAEERARLLDMIAAQNTGEYLARRQAAKPAGPKPIASVPAEAVEARPRALGL